MEQNTFLIVPALLIAILMGMAAVYLPYQLLQKIEHDQRAAVRISYAGK